MHLIFITDPLTQTFGSVRPAINLGKEFHKMGYEITYLTNYSSQEVREYLDFANVKVISNSHPKFLASIPLLREWMKSLIFPAKVKDELLDFSSPLIIINTSASIISKAHIYYAQGLVTMALDDISKSSDFPLRYKLIYSLTSPIFRSLEKRLVREIRDSTRFFISNSFFTKKLYESWGMKVDDVIYPPLDTSLFKPSTSRPSEDYVLVYLGVRSKETNLKVVKELVKRGVKVKAFGRLDNVPNLGDNFEHLGFVSEKELVELYSNALFTLFLFTHEPFGYIPIESMACGTPVLTYNKQGPRETVENNETGWLAESDKEVVEVALKIWREGYDRRIRVNCVESALKYDVKRIAEEWIKRLNVVLNE